MTPDSKEPIEEEREQPLPGETDGIDEEELDPHPPERPLFPHPQWTVGVVMVFAFISIFAGLKNPIWFLIGSPFIIAMLIFFWVRYRL